MLRSAVRRAWRLARPLQAALQSRATNPRGGTLHHLGPRNFSSTLSATGTGSGVDQDGVKNVKKGKFAPREEKALAVLRTYKEVNGDLLVPYAFVVPHGDSNWPPAMWGFTLGHTASRLRSQRRELSPELEEELQKLGFVYDKSQYKWDHIILPALRTFRLVHGHADVARYFIVPTGDDSWPRPTWGHRLGYTVNDIRHNGVYRAQVAMSREEFDKMGFCYDMTIADRDWNEKILPSLRVYRAKFGDCIIPNAFMVPSSPPWPEKAWGMPLGTTISDLRTGKSYVQQTTRDKDKLDAIGFAWNRSAAMWNNVIIPSLEATVCKYGNVPPGFVVPSEDPWPKQAWGKKLGKIIYQARYQGSYFAHFGRDIEKLCQLGLELKLAPPAWKRHVAPLLAIYAELSGEGEVPLDFVIPPEAPWEEKVWGVRLGLVVALNSHFMPRK